MQTWITDTDISVSAHNLDRQRLGAQMYEGIHILASLCGVCDKLVNPKRDVSSHPASKLWKGYEDALFAYLCIHIIEWDSRGYKTQINMDNMRMLSMCVPLSSNGLIDFITSELITTHRSVLIAKKPDHYAGLWTDCPQGLKMRYDWREKA
jgi:hypothetical protein